MDEQGMELGTVKRQQSERQEEVLTEVFSQLDSFTSEQLNLLLTIFSEIFQYFFNIFL